MNVGRPHSWRSLARVGTGRRQRSVSDARRKRLGLRDAVAALGVYPACLVGCRIGARVELKADGSQYTGVVSEDTTGSMATLNRNCGNLKRYFAGFNRFAEKALVEDITPAGGHLRCKATLNVPHDEVTAKDNADTLLTSMKPLPLDGVDLDGLTMTTTITMSGKVIRSSTGKVHGNKVVIDGYNYPITGSTITFRKNNSTGPDTGPTASKSTTSTATPTGTQSSYGDSSLWAWAGVGCTMLAALTLGGLATLWFTRKKKQHTAQAVNSPRPEIVSVQPPDSLNLPR